MLVAALVGWIVVSVLFAGISAADGPGVAGAAGFVGFLGFGAVAGFGASLLAIFGEGRGWRRFQPTVILPTVFLIGLVSPYLYVKLNRALYSTLSGIGAQVQQKMNAPPSVNCLSGQYAVRIGAVEFRLPMAQSFQIRRAHPSQEFYSFWDNQHVRDFCHDIADGIMPLQTISINLYEDTGRQASAVEGFFCAHPHPSYSWAEMACDRRRIGDFSDMPTGLSVSVAGTDAGALSSAQAEMAQLSVSVAPDGLKIYRGSSIIYLQRPDGYLARCYSRASANQPYLDCVAQENLEDGLSLSYSFSATVDGFLAQSKLVAANANAILASLRSAH